jgi:surface antigen
MGVLRASYGADLPHTRERRGLVVAGLVIRAVSAVALMTLAVALILLTRELASWRAHVPDVMAESSSWQAQSSGIQDQAAQLQPRLDAALTVTQDVVAETARVRREIPPMVREVERARRTVDAVLPRVDGALSRIDDVERTLPEVLETAKEAVAEAKRANDALPGIIEEVRATRAEAEQLVANAEQVVRNSRKAGKEASEGAVAGVFTGVFKLPFTSVAQLRRSRQDTLDFERELTDQDREMIRARSREALADPSLGSPFPWRNEQSGNSGAITAQRAYVRKGRPCRELAYVVQLRAGEHQAHLELCKESAGDRAGEWQVTGVSQD